MSHMGRCQNDLEEALFAEGVQPILDNLRWFPKSKSLWLLPLSPLFQPDSSKFSWILGCFSEIPDNTFYRPYKEHAGDLKKPKLGHWCKSMISSWKPWQCPASDKRGESNRFGLNLTWGKHGFFPGSTVDMIHSSYIFQEHVSRFFYHLKWCPVVSPSWFSESISTFPRL